MKGVAEPFQKIADTLKHIEQNEVVETDHEITTVTPRNTNLLDTDSVAVEIEILLPFIDSESLDKETNLAFNDIEFTEDGSLRANLVATVNHSSKETDGTGAPSHEVTYGDPTDPKTNGETGSIEEEQTEKTRSANQEQSRDASKNKPAYKDPNRLREVYENHDTFNEMTAALDVEVTPQTVRRYMIKHGIHEPASRKTPTKNLLSTNPDAVSTTEDNESQNSQRRESTGEKGQDSETRNRDTESRDVVSDGTQNENCSTDNDEADQSSERRDAEKHESQNDQQSAQDTTTSEGTTNHTETDSTLEEQSTEIELPPGLSIEQVKETVHNSKTLLEVQNNLNLDREEAQQLLQDLNLLDLVHGRIATRDRKDQTLDEINRRVQSATSREQAH